MSLKAKHFLQPKRTAAVAKSMFAAHLNTLKFARAGAARYRQDARYDLKAVTDGYAPHLDDGSPDDTALLERICTAYVKAVNHPQTSSVTYQATDWWGAVRRDHLGPVIHALTTHDTRALQRMYRNFYRDACSTGLFHRPMNISRAGLRTGIGRFNRQFILGDALYRLDYWRKLTGNIFPVSDLAGPAIGNPFGVVTEGTLIRIGTEYQHYCAERVRASLELQSRSVVEIGGGFGGTAYYLLRDRRPIKYFDFDVPESIALTSYYLVKALPELSFLLYGEGAIDSKSNRDFDVALMPLFEMSKVRPNSIDVTFSSHAMSDIHPSARNEYLQYIERMTRGYFWYIGDGLAGGSMQSYIAGLYSSFQLAEKNPAEWNKHRIADPDEVELLYRVEPPILTQPRGQISSDYIL